MASIGTGYDLSTTTFSPDGRVFQVEYAAKSVENSGTVVGIRCKDGVVLAVEKMVVSKMLVAGTVRRAHLVDRHAALAVCGMVPDGRVIVEQARDEGERYRDFYGRDIPGHILADRIAHFVHLYTLHWSVRPFGCAVQLAVFGDEGPQLYMIEPSGVSYRYYACAYGKGRQAARTELEKLKLNAPGGEPNLTCKEAVKELAKIIVGVHDDAKDKEYEIEMVWVSDQGSKKAQLVPKDLIESAQKQAIAAAQEDDMDDE